MIGVAVLVDADSRVGTVEEVMTFGDACPEFVHRGRDPGSVEWSPGDTGVVGRGTPTTPVPQVGGTNL